MTDVLVVGDAGEQVMRAGGYVGGGVPLSALQRHVTLFLLLLHVLEQHRHPMTRRVLQGEGDEDESDAKQAELFAADGVFFVVPLVRSGVAEGESSPRESVPE